MNGKPPPYRHKKHMIAAGMLGVVGLITALCYMVQPHPYTMVMFLMFGQTLMVLGMALFLYAVAMDIRSRMNSLVEKRFQKGEILFREGDFGDCLYILNKGQVEVLRDGGNGDENVLATLEPGEHFGEMALLSNAPRNATVRAATDVETLAIHRDDFLSLHDSIPALRHSIDEALQKRQSGKE